MSNQLNQNQMYIVPTNINRRRFTTFIVPVKPLAKYACSEYDKNNKCIDCRDDSIAPNGNLSQNGQGVSVSNCNK